MEKTVDGTLRLSPTVVEHFDRCLGCMACVSSCPSGVRYDRLIEETRAGRRGRAPAAARRAAPAEAALRHPPPPAPAPGGAPARPARTQAARARLGDADARPRAAVAVGRASGARHPGSCRFNTSPSRRPPDRLRAVGAVRRRERRDRARAGGGRLRGARTSAGLLRRALPARGSRAGVREAHGAAARELRRARDDRRQRLGLRLAPQGPRGAGARRDRGARRSRRCPSCDRSSSPSPTRTRATSGTRSGCPPPGGRCSSGFPGCESSSPPSRTSAAARQGSTTSRSPPLPGSSATARRGTSSRRAPDAYASANPGCLVQVSQALGRAGARLPALHPVELIDASLRAVPAADLLAHARR